jgi:hypothetical protein
MSLTEVLALALEEAPTAGAASEVDGEPRVATLP